MSKAFDTINIHTLIRKLQHTKITNTIMHQGTLNLLAYRNHISSLCQLKTGVPQGGVLSPTLFKAKNNIFNNGRYTTNIPTDPHTVATTDINTNMRHVNTSLVSMHLATIGNNKILCTPPPHISNFEEILPRLTSRSLAQLRTNKSTLFKSYLDKVDAKSHPLPLCPFCNTHIPNPHHLFNCTHICTTS